MTSDLVERVKRLLAAYEDREEIDVAAPPYDAEHATTRFLLYYQMPLWMTAGVLDWYWHKSSDIEHTAGTKENLIHWLMFAEVGVPIVLGLFLEIDAGLLALMLAALVAHELTAFWDVAYAERHREVSQWEQHTHSFLEVLPFTGIAMAGCLHWDQVRALVGVDRKPGAFALRLKPRKLPASALTAIGVMILGGVVVPYTNELLRCLRARTS